MAEKHQETHPAPPPELTPEEKKAKAEEEAKEKQLKADEDYKKKFEEPIHHITLIRDALIRAGLDNAYVDVVATLLLTANK